MTDILDEILAFTEGYQAKRSPPHPRVALPSDLPAPHPLAPPFAPSPRGVQDDLNTFSFLRQSYPSKNQLVPVYHHPDSHHHHDPAAAAISAAISTCIRPVSSIPLPAPPPPPPPPSHPPSHSRSHISPHPHSALHHPSSKPLHSVPPSVARPSIPLTYQTKTTTTATASATPAHTTTNTNTNITNTTATTTATTATATNDTNTHTPPSTPTPTPPIFTMPSSYPLNTPTKRSFTEAALHAPPSPTDKRLKAPKPDVAVVMPPSAKSILERRERAIREGRRKDAKLTEAERRILRRLRNRESAERCRLRRVQQAALLEKKIEHMQVENKRLVAQAEEYQNTIRRLERVIHEFSGHNSA